MKEYFQIKHRDTALALKDFSKTTHTHTQKEGHRKYSEKRKRNLGDPGSF